MLGCYTEISPIMSAASISSDDLCPIHVRAETRGYSTAPAGGKPRWTLVHYGSTPARGAGDARARANSRSVPWRAKRLRTWWYINSVPASACRSDRVDPSSARLRGVDVRDVGVVEPRAWFSSA